MVWGLGAAQGDPQQLADAIRPDLHRMHIALLAQSRSGAVREAVARRDDIPFGIQAALAHDDLHEVRGGIAANPRAAVAVMHLIAEDSHHAVLLALAGNPSCPRDVAAKLAAHRRADVRGAAIRRLEVREAPDAFIPMDPDSRVPELRDRVSEPDEIAPVRATPPFGQAVGLPLEASVSRLAQRVGASQRPIDSHPHIAPATDLRVSAAS